MNSERRLTPERRTYKLDKLVRDGIYANMLDLGQIVIDEHPSGQRLSMKQMFEAKLVEELNEFRRSESYEKRIKEAADLMAAWDSYLRLTAGQDPSPKLGAYVDRLSLELLYAGIHPYFVRQKQDELKSQLGEFDQRRYVYSVSLLPEDEYNDYYGGQPDRFPRLS